MRIFKTTIVSLAIFVLAAFSAMAQLKIAVNEYVEIKGSPIGERVELIVLQDGTDLRGWTIRDNSDAQLWSGGVKFKNIPFWNNLRRGTIIVLKTRGKYEYVIDKKTGYIDLGCGDKNNVLNSAFSDYFEPYVANGDIANWDATWSLNHNNDMIQLMDASGNPHHTLGHTNNSAYLTFAMGLAGNKSIIYNPSMPTNLIAVYSYASSLAEYNSNSFVVAKDADKSNTVGMANRNASGNFGGPHSDYLRTLRQPDWNAPTLTAVPVNGGIQLTWNAATDMFPEDSSQGYMVLRSETPDTELPVDGIVYNVGDNIGTSTVLANVVKSTNVTYTDLIENCDVKYYYRVFAYRFNHSPQGYTEDDNPVNARGRSYNETSFAATMAERKSPEVPTIYVVNGKSVLCVGDIVNLKAKGLPANNNYTYTWKKSGAVNVGEGKLLDTLKVDTQDKTDLSYQLEIKNAYGCVSKSNIIDLTVLPVPVIDLSYKIDAGNYNFVSKNDTVRVCTGKQLTIKANTYATDVADKDINKSWYKDGKLITTGAPTPTEYDVKASGTYTFVASNAGYCADTSFKLTVIMQSYALTFNPAPATFTLGSSETDITKDVVVKNTASDTIKIAKDSILFTMPQYTLESPTVFPIVIAPGASVTFKVKFTYPSPGPVNLAAKLLIKTPCSPLTLDLTGIKADASSKIVATPNQVKYIIPLCEATKKDTVITLVGFGSDKKTIQTTTVSGGGYTVDISGLKTSLGDNDPTSVKVSFTASTEGVYTGTLKVVYKIENPANPNPVTLDVPFEIEVVKPALTPSVSSIDFKTLKPCQSEADTTMLINNPTKIEIKIVDQPSDSRVKFTNLPLIIPAGGSSTLNIHYTPDKNSDDFTYKFKALPCDFELEQRIISTLSNVIIYKFAKDEFDFGTISDCSNPGTVYQNIDLTVTGGVGQIESVTISPDFETDLTSATVLGATNKVKIGLKALGSKVYSGKLEVKFKPCGDVKTVVLKGVRTTPNYTMMDLISDKFMPFGETQPGESRTKSFKIKNNASDSLVVSGFKNLATPFKLKSPALPYTIKAGETGEFTIEYNQANDNTNDSVNVDITTSYPCDIAKTIVLTANAKSVVGLVNLQLSAPSKLTVEIGKTVDIPYSFISAGVTQIGTVNAKEFVLYLSYREDVAAPILASVGPLFTNTITSIGVQEFDHKSLYGYSKVTGIVDNTAGLRDGLWAKVRFKGLLGGLTKTIIKVDSVVFKSGAKVVTETCETELTVTGTCDFDKKTLQVGNAPKINSGAQVISGPEVEVNFTTAVDGYLCAKLVDGFGADVAVLAEGSYNSGEYSTRINVNSIANGLYYLTLYSGGEVYIAKILINK